MTTAQKLLTYAGLKKQSGVGSVAATPAIVGFGVNSGHILETPIESSYEDLTLLGATTSDRFAPATFRQRIQPGAAFTTYATHNMLASMMLAALGTDSSVTTTHTETPGLTLPYFGLMGKFGAGPEVTRLNDAKMNSLELAWSEGDPLMLNSQWFGCSVTPDFTWTATNDDAILAPLQPFGGTFQFDVDSTSLANEPIFGGSVVISNNLVPVFTSAAIQPVEIAEGRQTVEGVLNVRIADLDEWQNILTGTAGGTTARSTPLYGALKLTFTNGTQSLDITANRVEYLTDFPDSDPAGGPAEVALAFRVVRPTDGSAAITGVVVNALSGAIT